MRAFLRFLVSPILSLWTAIIWPLWDMGRDKYHDIKRGAPASIAKEERTVRWWGYVGRWLGMALWAVVIALIVSYSSVISIGGMTFFSGTAGWMVGLLAVWVAGSITRAIGALFGLGFIHRKLSRDPQSRANVFNKEAIHKLSRFALFGDSTVNQTFIPSWLGVKKYVVEPLLAGGFCFAAAFALFGSSFLAVPGSTFMGGILVSEVFRFALAAFAVSFIVQYVFRKINPTAVETPASKVIIAQTEAFRILDLLDEMDRKIAARGETATATPAEEKNIALLKKALRKHIKAIAPAFRVTKVSAKGAENKKTEDIVKWQAVLVGYSPDSEYGGLDYKTLKKLIKTGEFPELNLKYRKALQVENKHVKESKLEKTRKQREQIRRILQGFTAVDSTANPPFSGESKYHQFDRLTYPLISAAFLFACIYALFSILTGGMFLITSKIGSLVIAASFGFAAWVTARFTLAHTSGGIYGEWAMVLGMSTITLLSVGGLLWSHGLVTPFVGGWLVAAGLLSGLLGMGALIAATKYAHKEVTDRATDRKELRYKTAERALIVGKVAVMVGCLLLAFSTIAMLFDLGHLGQLSDLMNYAATVIVQKLGIGGYVVGAEWLSVFSVFTLAGSLFIAYQLLKNLLQLHPETQNDVQSLKKNNYPSLLAKGLKVLFTMGMFAVLLALPLAPGFSYIAGFNVQMLRVFAVLGLFMPLLSGNANLLSPRINRLYNQWLGTELPANAQKMSNKALWARILAREFWVFCFLLGSSLLFGYFIVGNALFASLGGATLFLFTGMAAGALIFAAAFSKNPTIKKIAPIVLLGGSIAALFAIVVNSSFTSLFSITGNPAALVLMIGVLTTMGFRFSSLLKHLGPKEKTEQLIATLEEEKEQEKAAAKVPEIEFPNLHLVNGLKITAEGKVREKIVWQSYVYELTTQKLWRVDDHGKPHFIKVDHQFEEKLNSLQGVRWKHAELIDENQSVNDGVSNENGDELDDKKEDKKEYGSEKSAYLTRQQLMEILGSNVAVETPDDIDTRFMERVTSLANGTLLLINATFQGGITKTQKEIAITEMLKKQRAKIDQLRERNLQVPTVVYSNELENFFKELVSITQQSASHVLLAEAFHVWQYGPKRVVERAIKIDDFVIEQQDVQIHPPLTQAQKAIWMRIHDKASINRPAWFNQLPLFAQNLLREIVPTPQLQQFLDTLKQDLKDSAEVLQGAALMLIHRKEAADRPKGFDRLSISDQKRLKEMVPTLETVDDQDPPTIEKVEKALWENFEDKTIPSTLRHMLGVSNAWQHRLVVVNEAAEHSVITASRMAVPSSIAMPMKSEKEAEEQQESTQLNLQQMLDAEIAPDEKNRTAREAFLAYWGLSDKKYDEARNPPENQAIKCPILLAGLVTNLEQANLLYGLWEHTVNRGEDNNERMFRHQEAAVEAYQVFYQEKGYELIHINAAVNVFRNPDFDFSTHPNHQRLIDAVNRHIRLVEQHHQQATPLTAKINQLKELSNQINKIAKPEVTMESRNRALHYIALCIRLMQKMHGISILNCKSSKDRTAAVMLYADALEIYSRMYHEEFQYEASDEQRARFVEIYCTLLMRGQQFEMASANAPGAFGIKGGTLFDSDIIARLKKAQAWEQMNVLAEFNKPGSLLNQFRRWIEIDGKGFLNRRHDTFDRILAENLTASGNDQEADTKRETSMGSGLNDNRRVLGSNAWVVGTLSPRFKQPQQQFLPDERFLPNDSPKNSSIAEAVLEEDEVPFNQEKNVATIFDEKHGTSSASIAGYLGKNLQELFSATHGTAGVTRLQRTPTTDEISTVSIDDSPLAPHAAPADDSSSTEPHLDQPDPL